MSSEFDDEVLLEYLIEVTHGFNEQLMQNEAFKSIPETGKFRDYLQQIADIINTLLPARQQGIGKELLLTQLNKLNLIRSLADKPILDLNTSDDCKLPSFVMFELLKQLSSEKGWNLQISIYIRKDSTHPRVVIEVPETSTLPLEHTDRSCWIIDFNFLGKPYVDVGDHPKSILKAARERDTVNIFSEPKEAVLGLDKMYQEALQQQSKSKPDA